MKLLKERKLLNRPEQLESRQGKIFRKIRHLFSEVVRRKMFVFNLIVLLATAGYAVKYLIDRDEGKRQAESEQQEIDKAGARLRDIFFNSVYEDEMKEQRELEEAEERRKASIAASTIESEPISEGQKPEEAEVDSDEEISEEEQLVIDAKEILENIEKDNDEEFPIYENKLYKYTIKYPPNWYLDKETNVSSWLAYLTSYDPVSHNRSELPQTPRLEILVQENLRNLSLDEWMQEGYKYNGEPTVSEKIQIAGIDAYRNIEANPYPAIVVTLIHTDFIYTFSFAGGDIANEDNIKILDFMLNNLKFQ